MEDMNQSETTLVWWFYSLAAVAGVADGRISFYESHIADTKELV